MIDFGAFSEELVKLAEAGATVGITVVKRLPKDQEEALQRISSKIDMSKSKVLGFPSVAVEASKIGDLKELGFKKTRAAVPLPWERAGTVSWRRGNIHAHKKGSHYVLHKDEVAPIGAVSSVKHWAMEGLPAAKKRFLGKHPQFDLI